MPLWERQVLLTASPDDSAEAVAAHREHVAELRASGVLRASVEYGRGDGFLEIFEAADLREAERIAGESPLVTEGMGSWTLRGVDSFTPGG
jgi:uncharacterized protein YciI